MVWVSLWSVQVSFAGCVPTLEHLTEGREKGKKLYQTLQPREPFMLCKHCLAISQNTGVLSTLF